jgi:hypothetical protein
VCGGTCSQPINSGLTAPLGAPAQAGATDLDNLLSLCHFHHRRLHDGSFVVRAHPDFGVVFERPDGRPILRPAQSVDPGVPREEALRGLLPAGAELHIDADTARAKEATERLDLGYVVSAVLDGVSRGGQLSA